MYRQLNCKFYFQVSIPNLRDSNEYLHVRDKLGLMIDTAVALGAETERATSEMTEIYDFLLNLREVRLVKSSCNKAPRFI